MLTLGAFGGENKAQTCLVRERRILGALMLQNLRKEVLGTI
ncbi:hypothetical protein VSP9026_01548 [Vibrio spartinae]|uniref:Uncharacterized protein n=1 Tax=Vibrio spartinae TaxID=1918945 RepID=A0A1N6M351_9VIBR|nr:hypothetical protein VSP9026_01548 [Vibrio spartinae]